MWLADKVRRYDDLTAFLTSCEADSTTPPEIPFVLEFLMMSLHVALDDIQLFAGREGEDEARRIFPQVRAWTRDAESRKAVWHAGQVFNHAKAFEKTRLRDFYAVAMYHATLVLWVWGMVTSGSGRQSGVETPIGTTFPQNPPPQIAFTATKSCQSRPRWARKQEHESFCPARSWRTGLAERGQASKRDAGCTTKLYF